MRVGNLSAEDDTSMAIEARLTFSLAEIMLIRVYHPEPDEHSFRRDGMFWIDLCLTPRRPAARGRYVDHWGPHRYAALGSTMALPPQFDVHLKNEGGRHISLICALQSAAVERWLPDDFEWTDRRMEACLDIADPTIRDILQRLTREIRRPGIATRELSEALIFELSVELARYLVAIAEPAERGGLATWRLRVIDKRLEERGELPTLNELASLCSVSVRQLTRGFRTSRGSSIGDYMNQFRIEAAKRRLAGDESIKSIATSVGFADQSTFTYAFRRATGFTPLQFRRRVLQRVDRHDG